MCHQPCSAEFAAPAPGTTSGLSNDEFEKRFPDCERSAGCWGGLRKNTWEDCINKETKTCLFPGSRAPEVKKGTWECVACYHAAMPGRGIALCPGKACRAIRLRYLEPPGPPPDIPAGFVLCPPGPPTEAPPPPPKAPLGNPPAAASSPGLATAMQELAHLLGKFGDDVRDMRQEIRELKEEVRRLKEGLSVMRAAAACEPPHPLQMQRSKSAPSKLNS